MSSPRLVRGRASRLGACYTITIVVAGRRPQFGNAVLAALAVQEFRRAACTGMAVPHAWVVMPDHVHWLFELREDALSRCVQRFKSRSARAVNAAVGVTGVFWQPGFYDHCLRDEEDLRTQARYIVANPLRRGLVRRIEDYPFWWCRWVSGSQDL